MTSDLPEPRISLLTELEATIAELAASRGPAVVGIGRSSGRGTGIVIGDGEVLTLASNLADPSAAVAVHLSAGVPSLNGDVIGLDRGLDLALIRVATGSIEPLRWAAELPRLGAAVIALANPAGQGLRATLGFVAATGRSFRGPRGRVVRGGLEHTAALPRGAGGGPLLDRRGEVVGLNAVRIHGGLILTLPAAALSHSAELLRAPGRPGEPPVLGVAIVAADVARRLRRAVGLSEREGLLVHGVADGSAAGEAGIRAGDLIVAAAGAPLEGVDALYAALDQTPSDGSIDLLVVRGVDEHEISVSLAPRG